MSSVVQENNTLNLLTGVIIIAASHPGIVFVVFLQQYSQYIMYLCKCINTKQFCVFNVRIMKGIFYCEAHTLCLPYKLLYL